MLESFDIINAHNQIMAWTQAHVINSNFFIQATIIIAALALGLMCRKFFRPRLQKHIDTLRLAPRNKNMLHSFSRLIFQASALIILWLAAMILEAGFSSAISAHLVKAVSGLLMAWIIIRLVVQFIPQAPVRNIFALIVWTIAALAIFGILEQTTAALDAVGMNIGEFRLSALTVIKSLIAIFVLLYMALFTSSVLEQRIQTSKGLSISSRVLISKIVRVLLVTFALLIGVTAAGVDLSLFAVFSGALGLGVGFGLQKGISNLFSGMLLLMDKSIKPGDVIELQNGSFGWVERMGARYTEIITRDNKSYLVPNEDFITQQVINWSHGNTLIRLELKFGVDYSHNPHEIKAMAEQAALKPERVVQDPAPVCHLVEFSDSALTFSLRFWIRDAEKGITNMRGGVMLALWDVFQENNIKIPYPHRELYIHRDENAA